MSRPEAQRRGAISEMSKERRERAAADERRRQYEAATRDKEANQRARQEFAEISQRQLSRAPAQVDLDDAEPQQRQRQKLVAPAPALIADDREARLDDQQRRPNPPAQEPTGADLVIRGAKAASWPRSDAAEAPAAPSGEAPKPAQVSDATPIRQAKPGAASPTAQSRGMFVVVEQRAERRSPRGQGRSIEYLPESYSGGWAIGDYIPSPRNNLILCAAVAIISIVLISWFWDSPQVRFYRGNLALGGGSGVTSGSNLSAPEDADGAHAVVGDPTVAANLVDEVLAKYGSPAAGTGRIWVEMGRRYGIDPAYALAFFIHESSAGTNPGWAGLKPGGGSTHNIGNIICAGYRTCFGRFRDYDNWEAGIEDWYKLISEEYVNGRGAKTVEQIIPIYAPSSDNNDPAGYIQSVVDLVKGWRQGVIQ